MKRERKILNVLLILTLIASAIHFVDNAFRLDLYPGPAWLTRNLVLAAWLIVVACAYLAYKSGSRWALVAYGLLGFAGLAHYRMPHARLSPRCALTIGAEAITSALLIGFVLLRPQARMQR